MDKQAIIDKHWLEFLNYANAENDYRIANRPKRAYLILIHYDESDFWEWYAESKLAAPNKDIK